MFKKVQSSLVSPTLDFLGYLDRATLSSKEKVLCYLSVISSSDTEFNSLTTQLLKERNIDTNTWGHLLAFRKFCLSRNKTEKQYISRVIDLHIVSYVLGDSTNRASFDSSEKGGGDELAPLQGVEKQESHLEALLTMDIPTRFWIRENRELLRRYLCCVNQDVSSLRLTESQRSCVLASLERTYRFDFQDKRLSPLFFLSVDQFLSLPEKLKRTLNDGCHVDFLFESLISKEDLLDLPDDKKEWLGDDLPSIGCFPSEIPKDDYSVAFKGSSIEDLSLWAKMLSSDVSITIQQVKENRDLLKDLLLELDHLSIFRRRKGVASGEAFITFLKDDFDLCLQVFSIGDRLPLGSYFALSNNKRMCLNKNLDTLKKAYPNLEDKSFGLSLDELLALDDSKFQWAMEHLGKPEAKATAFSGVFEGEAWSWRDWLLENQVELSHKDPEKKALDVYKVYLSLAGRAALCGNRSEYHRYKVREKAIGRWGTVLSLIGGLQLMSVGMGPIIFLAPLFDSNESFNLFVYSFVAGAIILLLAGGMMLLCNEDCPERITSKVRFFEDVPRNDDAADLTVATLAATENP